MQSWIYLTGAIMLEVAGTSCMKLSEGFSRLIPSVLIFVLTLVKVLSILLILIGVVGLNLGDVKQ